MIGGTVLAGFGLLLSCAEARQHTGDRNILRSRLEDVAVLTFLCGPAAFLLEFAYGIPQFPLVNDPLIQAIAATLAFVLAAFRGARWVIGLWVAYLVVQLVLAGLNVVVFDALMPWPASLLGGAAVGVVLTRFARPTLAFGALGGAAVAVGTIGVDYVWTNQVRPMAWPAAMIPQALLYGVVVGTAVGVISVWLKVRLGAVAGVEAPPLRWSPLAGVGLVVLLGVFGVNVPPRDDAHVAADVTAFDRTGGSHASARLRIEVLPHDAADGAWWFETLSWQGGGAVHGDLHEVSPGVYETDRRVPAYGDWKTLVRLHLPAHTLLAAPVYLPADEAIPVPEHSLANGPRDFVEEARILRREERTDVPAWLWSASYAVVGGLFLALFAAIGAGVSAAARQGRTGSHRPGHLTGAGR